MNKVFTSEDYKSDNGMMTSIWGPPAWHFLHCISFNYPVNPTPEQKKKYYNYVMSFGQILPCKYCRDNFNKNIKSIKFTMKDMKNRDTFSKIIYELHETVNDMLGKESGLSYEEVKDRYELFRSRCVDQPDKIEIYEKGCTEPIYKGAKSKCVLKIIPKTDKCESITINSKCLLKKIKKKKKKSGKKKSGKKKN